MFPFRSRILANACAALMLFAGAPSAAAQEHGRLMGRVLDSAGTSAAGVSGVVVVAVNQVSTKTYRARTKPDGTYSLRLPAGAYRVRLEAPFKASFDSKGKYGPFAIPRGEALENVDVEPGRITYTTILNERAGVEMDPTVTRLSEDRFLVLAPTLAQRRTEWLLRNGCPGGVTVTDVSGGLAAIHLAGPGSRDLLGRLTHHDLSDQAFPFLSAQQIEEADIEHPRLNA